ncbi:O-fucosyltransferase family protein [Lacibacter sediminis]|uniref:Alpha-1,2-fucosyltransferase n=1 Tax=Lacibacter sediminis TaxID=2760713 RepID=A0A7G5XHP3_9BACT|nr:hypothetical protein [Lacibacter sediminis]QNA44996.1 hypothetical protein H4075_02035 [Lacibacter sediminis]
MTGSTLNIDNEIARQEYQKLNASFSKKLVFHLGAEAGFFSEYNNMIFAMLYCLQEKIRFVLYSEDANFGYRKGWTDYFIPFCEEDVNPHHSTYNKRRPYTYKRRTGKKTVDAAYNTMVAPLVKQRNSLRDQLAKVVYFKETGPFYYTHELWEDFHSREMENKTFHFPDLQIYGDLRSASRRLTELTWIYNHEVKSEIDGIISSLNLPDEYVGLHIRGGDKFVEFDLHEIDTYINKATSLSNCRNAFVLTDDYRIIEQLNQKYPDWHIYTLCDKESRGYFHWDFIKLDKTHIRNQHVRLFASTDVLNKAAFFVGTFNSNVGAYLGVRMDRDKCFGVDFDDWRIF